MKDTFIRSCEHWSESSRNEMENFYALASIDYKYLAEKASISINGVSLTISKVNKKTFEINVIPHTLKLTNLKDLKNNNIVNVELDIFGKYIFKLSKQ